MSDISKMSFEEYARLREKQEEESHQDISDITKFLRDLHRQKKREQYTIDYLAEMAAIKRQEERAAAKAKAEQDAIDEAQKPFEDERERKAAWDRMAGRLFDNTDPATESVGILDGVKQ